MEPYHRQDLWDRYIIFLHRIKFEKPNGSLSAVTRIISEVEDIEDASDNKNDIEEEGMVKEELIREESEDQIER